MPQYYAITAMPNLTSIMTHGLLTSARFTNPYGLDTDVDYDAIYGEKVSEEFKRPASIHLIKDLKTAREYKLLIEKSFNTAGVIFKVNLDESFKVFQDPEERMGVYCLQNIPPQYITFPKLVLVLNGVRSTLFFHPDDSTSSNSPPCDLTQSHQSNFLNNK